MRRVLERGWFVLGPEVDEFESELAVASGADHAVTLASGTDALIFGLRSIGVVSGDEVIIPDVTAFPTAAAVLEAQGTPVLVDVEPHRPLLDLERALDAVTPRTKAVVVVHLYGVCADVAAFREAFGAHDIAVVEDCAQAQGATLPTGEPVGTVGTFGALSFYPTKNLGAAGDGGAVITNDGHLADELRAWRAHGERGERYWHELPARNSRLDELHAAILRLRLLDLDSTVAVKRSLSDRYGASLDEAVRYVSHGVGGAPHLAVVRVERRDEVARRLAERGIGTGVHYPHPLSDQPALSGRASTTETPNARLWAAECLTLPLHPRLSADDVDIVASTLNEVTADLRSPR